MRVTKRDGSVADVDFREILVRLETLASIDPPLQNVNLARIAQTVVAGVVDLISTRDIDRLAAETAAGYAAEDPDNDALAARIAVADLHRRTHASFRVVVELLHANRGGAPAVTDELLTLARECGDRIDAETDHSRDYRALTYFGVSTLRNGYLLQTAAGEPAERPAHMYWRVALGIHGRDWDRALSTYRALAAGALTHATPTLFNAGTPTGALSSCYVTLVNDSIEGIYDTVKDCAVISKAGGGLGVAVSRVRADGAIVRSTGRRANGIMPALRVMNETARHVTQGGKRKGAIAVYVEPHHADVFAIVDVRKNTGVESERARDLFPAIWASDLFMERVAAGAEWSLFSPDTAPRLDDVHGDEFRAMYEDYERRGLAVRTVAARDLWDAIMVAQIETGTPYLLYKDTINRASAQANIGIVRSSNLCSEITLHTSDDETAVCNLASISLPHFVTESPAAFDFAALERVTAIAVANLDAVIDRTFYPTPAARRSNLNHRPIGIGVQGLADTFMAMRLPFDSPGARELNVRIFETIYRAAVSASCDLARERGAYATFAGSPASRGALQPDLFLAGGYGDESDRARLRERVNTPEWAALRARVIAHGLRHSVVTALMPTASTSQILGNVEAFEALGSNLYVRRTLAGEFTLTNARLVRDLRRLGHWSESVRHEIVRADGSVQALADVPDDTKKLYRTVWEIPQRSVCEMAADRAPFVDQSQSLNVHMAAPTTQKLSSLHFHNWRAGLKTSSYYVRTRAAASAIKFTVPQNLGGPTRTGAGPDAQTCVLGDNAGVDGVACESCSA